MAKYERTRDPAARAPLTHFDVGDRVMHPRHGAGEVVARVRRRVLGSARDYLEIEMACESLRILVPCDGTAAVGLRAVAGPRGVQRIVDVLEAESEPELADENWSARKRRNLATLKDGDVLGLAAVIRDLVRRSAAGTLLPSERELLDRSRAVLASELRYALGVGAEQADAYIDEHIKLVATTDVGGGPAGSVERAQARPAER